MSAGHYPRFLLQDYLELTKGQLSGWLEYFDPRPSDEHHFTWGQFYQYQILSHLVTRCDKSLKLLSRCQLEDPLKTLSELVIHDDMKGRFLIIDYVNKSASLYQEADFSQLTNRYQPTHLNIIDLHHLYRLHDQRMKAL